MAARRCFTLDEALAVLLAEEENNFFGTDDVNFCSDELAVRDENVEQKLSCDGHPALPQTVDPDIAAAAFLGFEEPSNTAEDMENTAGDERDEVAMAAAAEPVLDCCKFNCLKQLDAGEIEAPILNMRAMEGTESDLVILSKLDLCRHSGTHTGQPGKCPRTIPVCNTVCVAAFCHQHDTFSAAECREQRSLASCRVRRSLARHTTFSAVVYFACLT